MSDAGDEMVWRAEWLAARAVWVKLWENLGFSTCDAERIHLAEQRMQYAQIRGLCCRFGIPQEGATKLAETATLLDGPWFDAPVIEWRQNDH